MEAKFTRAIEILYFAKQNDVEITLDGDQLRLKTPKGKAIDKDLLQKLGANKQLIIEFLKNDSWKSTIVDDNYKISSFDRNAVKQIPLSFSQERLWFVDRLEGSIQYHIPAVIKLKGEVNLTALENTLRTIVSRHEVLRSVILEDADGKGYQQIGPGSNWKLIIEDRTKEDKNSLENHIKQLVTAPFDLSKDYMLRANLLKTGNEEHVLLVTTHHIASDGWSASVLMKEVIEIYAAYAEGREAKLPPLPIQYADFAVWQRQYLQGEVLQNKLDYWKSKLSGVSPLEMPTDHPRLSVFETSGAAAKISIDKELSDKLQNLSHAQGVTLYMTLLSAFKVLLYRYSGQQDICVGTPVAGREQHELEGLIGFFVNTLALRTQVAGDLPFTGLLQNVRTTTLEAYGHQEVPFEKVVDAVIKERDMSRSPLFQVMFVFQNTPDVPELNLNNTRLVLEETDFGVSKYDLSFALSATADGLSGSIQYATALYNKETVERIISHYKILLRAIVASPDEKIGHLAMLAESEKQTLLHDFNATAAAYPKDKSVVALFEEQVSKNPNATAVIFGEKQLSYKELNERSNQLANYLVKKGVKAETLVPICVERSLEMVVGIFGILKAGGAYVPIDPEYPQDRIKYMLEDTGAALVLSSSRSREKLNAGAATVIELDGDWQEIAKEASTNLDTKITPDQLAYIIYTSGSTGRPKGVMIEHRNLVSYLVNGKTDYINDSGNCAGSFIHLSYTFDASLTGLFIPLLKGKFLVISSKDSLDVFTDPNLEKYAPYDFIKITPSHVGLLPIAVKNKESWLTGKLVIGGEALRLSQFDAIITEGIPVEIVNEYGPTEATVGCSTYSFNTLGTHEFEGNEVPIGKPISNARMYILSEDKEVVPIGVPGEIYIGGAGVARGYLNKKELTSEKFIADPFTTEAGARLYKTGDLGKWLADGNIQYMGRTDDQVKIRGYRIELGEIESILNHSDLIKQGVVLAKTDVAGNKRLVGYVVPAGMFDKQAIQTYLGSKLPDHMVPALWVELESIPLTSNGKVDKKALPDPELGDISTAYVAPANEIQKAIAGIWQDLLGVEQVGIYDNFFELGGDSILTIQVVSRLRRLGYIIQPKDIFNNQVIASLSDLISRGTDNKITGEQGILTGSFGLIPIQSWYLEKEPADISHYNQSVLIKINKNVTEQILQSVMDQLTSHHDALRLVFKKVKGLWQQEYSAAELKLDVDDLQDTSRDKLAETIGDLANKYQQSLAIDRGLLMRMVLMKTPAAESENRLLMVIHHLAVDGVSWRIILEDLEQLLGSFMSGKQASLGSKSSSYRQWLSALVKYGENQALPAQKEYWEHAVSNYKSLPEDKPYTGDVLVKDMLDIHVKLGSEQTRLLLQEVPKVYHTEINDILLAAMSTALCDWVGSDQVIIGLEGHGREAISSEIDSSRTVGWFTNLYPVLLKDGSNADALIKGVKEDLRRVPDKGLGYGVLKYIQRIEQLQGNDPWDIVFNYLGQLDTAIASGSWIGAAKESGGAGVSKNQLLSSKLSVNSFISGGELMLRWSYSDKHYNQETIARLADDYINQLTRLINHCLKQGKSGIVYTPSDYGLSAEITYEELDRFLDEPYKGDIRKNHVESIYRLSGLQQGMLFHGLYDGADSYLGQFSCDLVGANINVLLASWAEVIKHHSILRSGFYANSFSVPVQCVYRDAELPIDELDYRGMDEAALVAALKQYEAADRARGFDFKSAPLMRLGLIRISEDRYRMLWTSHHLLFDGWSFPIMIEEFLKTYELLISGKALPQAAEDRYEDYIRYLERRDKNAEEQHWRNYLDGINQGSLLPFLKTTTERTKGKGRYEFTSLRLDKATTARIQAYAQSHRLTANTLMQGIWALVLNRYTGSNDIMYGVIVSGRPAELSEVEQRVGMYINTLPFRASFNENREIASWLQGLQAEQVLTRQFQYASLQDLQEWAGVKGDIFDNVLIFDNYPVSKLVASREWSLRVENVEVAEQNNYPLTIIIGSSDELSISFSYNTDLLEQTYITAIREQFKQVLLQIADEPGSLLNDIRLLTPSQEQAILHDFNNTVSIYPADKSIAALFQEQVAKTPGATAIISGRQQLSYKELNERSNQLAHYLQKKGLKPGTLVPICIERSVEMMVGILGILKAGAAYVPIDPDYPQDRISYMLEDTGATLVLSSSDSRDKLGAGNISVIELDGDNELIGHQPTANLSINTNARDLAYVIYTSGSTGRPKGVMIEQRSVVSLVKGVDYVSLGADDTLLVTGSPSFDATTFEYWGMLLNGGKLVLCSLEDLLDSEKLKANIDKHKVSIMWFTSSWFNQLADNNPEVFSGLRTILAGGEKLSEYHIEKIRKTYPDLKLINGYGPTENTTFSLTYAIDKVENPIPIGRPLNNRTAYILTRGKDLSPVGGIGEICLGGAGIARGYLNNPELTAEKFINDPFSTEPGAKLYKTGDLGRWLPDGNIQYLGRMDDQVKIRGFRIELGEIESVLNQSELVNQSVVLAKEDNNGSKRLVAYVVPSGWFDKQELQEYLSSKLADYMVPAIWVELESMPLTSNGKVDKRALPDPELSDMAAEYVAPQNESELALAEIWQDLLELDQVGLNDNFFELGGDSLSAIRLISAIRKTLGTELPINDVFDYPTLGALAGLLKKDEPEQVLSTISVQVPRPEYIPLSFSQERLWFIDRLEGSVQYHMPTVLRLQGELNREALERTLKGIIARHEVLRTVILEQNGQGYQHVTSSNNWKLKVTEKSAGSKAEITAYITELIKKPFGLSNDYMLRADLIMLGNQDHILVVTMHHIASDGWSRSILVKEVIALYEGFTANIKVALPELPVQYADFSIWQRKQLQGELLENKLVYWKNKLKGVPSLQLPTDFGRPAIQSLRGATHNFTIDQSLSAQLVDFGRQYGATLYMTMLATFKLLLYRYSGQEDICVGAPIAGRQQQEIEGLIGFFVNTLALRSQVRGEMSFNELLEEVKTTTLEAYNHQEVPFEKVVDAVVTTRDMSRNPLFQVLFVLQNTPDIPELKLGGLHLSAEGQEHTTTTFDIAFTLNETNSGIRGTVEYSTDLYRQETIERIISHYISLLSAVIASPQSKASLLPMLAADEERQLLIDFNNTQADYPKDKSTVELFEEYALLNPDAAALIFEDTKLSYSELNSRSNQLANYLQLKGVKKDVLVPICIERSPEMIIAILGILKAGGAYVPIDPDYPLDRISYMLEDTGAKLAITSSETREKLGINNIAVIELNADKEIINGYSSANLLLKPKPRDLAYVIYTSGSTGRPKGVMIEHGGVVNLGLSQAYALQLKPGMRTLQFASFGFDASCYEVFNTYLSGGCLVLCHKEDLLSTQRFKELVAKNQIEVIVVPPSFQLTIDDDTLGILKTIVSAGEPLNEATGKHIQSHGVRLINAYGPTETTVCASLTDDPIKADNVITIGKPILNASIYILNANKVLCPIGVTGELCVGGAGLARGYLNRAELTAEKFIKDPFSRDPGARLYKTGDLARWLPDGNIEYQGRIDDQVKIRGFRIELGEIESVLNQSDLVQQGVVLAKEDSSGNKRLVAYVVPSTSFDKPEIQAYLGSKLPEYMVPGIWVEIQQMPLTPSGKIDRKALPDPELADMTTEYVAPGNETERALAKIWEELLNVERVGIHDNFFELGGHSLLAMRVVSSVRKELNIELNIRELFTYPVISGLGAYLDKQYKGSLLPAITVEDRSEYIPLSFSQERLWFIDQLEGSVLYHLPSVFRLKGQLDIERLERTLLMIINRHEVLRTVVLEHDGEGYQHVIPKDGWSLTVTEGHAEADLTSYVSELIAKPFDLSADYMMRANLIRLSEADHVLVVTMHHIASDGWSASILVNEVITLYEAYEKGREAELPALEIQYADYAIWQRKYLQGEVLENMLGYWKTKLSGVEPLQLPLDYSRPAVQQSHGAVQSINLDNELSARLIGLSHQQGATLYMTMLAAFKVLLYRYSGQEDICVGTPVPGRNYQELEGLIGFFINTLALRTELNGDMSFNKFLNEVKTTTLDAYGNQEAPFEKVVEAVVKERDLSRTPLFQVMFSLSNIPEVPEITLGNIKLSPVGNASNMSKFDLSLTLVETEEGISGGVRYNTDIFKEETISTMLMHFRELLKSISVNPEESLAGLKMLTSSEEHKLLIEFSASEVEYPRDKTIIDLFEEQAVKNPDAIALVFGQDKLTYKEVNEQASQLAHYLQNKGVKAETLVPICMERSSEMIVAMLGILKAGGAYVPIGPEYPQERISYMLEDTQAFIVVSSDKVKPKLQNFKAIEVIGFGKDWLTANSNLSKENLRNVANAKNLAYVLYTSGSTGKPKGAMIEHQSLLDHCFGVIKSANLKICRSMALFAPLVFDAGHSIIHSSLILGSALYVLSDEMLLDGESLSAYIDQNSIDCIKIVPSLWNYYADTEKPVLAKKVMIFGGEGFPQNILESLIKLNYKGNVYNHYGPTETTIGKTIHKVDLNKVYDVVPIGRPFSNTKVYILNKSLNLVPVGVEGELYIGGDGLARGYLNLQTLTTEKFIADPFGTEVGSRLYRTGDLVRWLPDGNIEYIGRVDDQVKIRGYRIELGEIESLLEQSGLVKQAVVLAKEDTQGTKRLVGYVVVNGEMDKRVLQDYLQKRLPEYMVPGLWVALQQLPVTSNGKINKKALPDPEIGESSQQEYVAPRNETERVLADIWQELMGVERIGIYDNFFERGGHSLLAMRVISAIRKRLMVSVPVHMLFRFTSISDLSKYIELEMPKNGDLKERNTEIFKIIDV
jgi:amino acid adenylation domain-containing protein/non-ribosomal peptide synthase protein (TIGR01720 family)